MNIRLTAAAVILAALIALPAAAEAQQRQNCKPRDEIVKILADKYQEHRIGVGMASPTQIMEVFASEIGTWTVLISRLDGVSCIVAAGQNWTDVPPPEPGDPT